MIDEDYLALGVVGETTWHVPFILGAMAAGAVMYFWPQKQTFFAGCGYTPQPYRGQRRRR